MVPSLCGFGSRRRSAALFRVLAALPVDELASASSSRRGRIARRLRSAWRPGSLAYGQETDQPRFVGSLETLRGIRFGTDAVEYIIQLVRRTASGQPARCDP